MKLQILSNRVLVKRLAMEAVTPGGIFLPDAAKEKSQQAKVLGVGEGKLLENGEIRPMTVKVGDIILLPGPVGTKVTIDGEECLIMCEEDILAIHRTEK